MAYTLTTAMDEVRDFLNEQTAAFWTDAEIQDWIKQGVVDFTSKSLMFELTGDLTLVAGQLSYDSTDLAGIGVMIEPYAAIYSDSGVVAKGLVKVHPRKLGNMLKFTSGVPRYYAFHARTVYVWPVVSATEVAAGAEIKFLFSGYTDDITAIADEYQHIPMMYAKAMCKMKDQKFQEAQSLMSMYISMTNFERQDKHAREEDTYDMFKIKGSGGEQRAG